MYCGNPHLITSITIKVTAIHPSLEFSHFSAKEHKSIENSAASNIQCSLNTSYVSTNKKESLETKWGSTVDNKTSTN